MNNEQGLIVLGEILGRTIANLIINGQDVGYATIRVRQAKR